MIHLAKVDGPLFSLEARGAIGNGIVFFPWKGRHAVRRWLKPTNPQSDLQGYVRTALKALGKAVAKILLTGKLYAGLLASCPAGLNWNAFFTQGFLTLCSPTGTFSTSHFESYIGLYSTHAQKTDLDERAITALELEEFTFSYGYTTPVAPGFMLYAAAVAAYKNAASWGTAYTLDPDSFAASDVTNFAAAFLA